jgi:hypothetical protein
MKNGGWLDSYADGGTMQEHQENYNDYKVSAPEGMVGDGFSNVGRNYSPAWGGQFEDGGLVPIAQDGRATRADSLAVYNNAKKVMDYYKKSGKYKETSSDTGPNFDLLLKENDENLKKFKEWNKDANISVPLKSGKRGDVKIPESAYRKNIDKNKYLQRESAMYILDTRSPMQLFDKRISPTMYSSYLNTKKGDVMEGDAVGISGYDPLSVMPWDMFKNNPKLIAERIKKFGTSGIPKSYLDKLKPNEIISDEIIPIQRPKLEALQPLTKQGVVSDFSIDAQLPVIRPEARMPKSFDVNSQRQTMSGPSEYYDYSGEGVDISDAVRAKQSADTYNQYVKEKYEEAAKSNPKAQKRLEQLMQNVELTPNYQTGGDVTPTYSYPLRDKLYPGEDEYFKANPHVRGMAAEDNQVIINPYSGLTDEEKQGIRMNETARLAMRNGYERPTFELTPEQKEFFNTINDGKPYSTDEQDIRETIIGRILSGDSSAGNVTPEQKKYAEELQNVLKFQGGGSIPGATGSMYARVGAPSNGPYAKKTMASAQDGKKFKLKDERGLVMKPSESTSVKKRDFDLMQSKDNKAYNSAVVEQKKEAARRAKLTKDQREREDYNAYAQEHGNITKSVPETAWERTKAIVSNPMTAIGYKVRGENLPGRFQFGPRNEHDYALDWINPLQGAAALSEIPGELGRGEFMNAGLSGLDALDLGVYARGAKKALKPVVNKGINQLGNINPKGKIFSGMNNELNNMAIKNTEKYMAKRTPNRSPLSSEMEPYVSRYTKLSEEPYVPYQEDDYIKWFNEQKAKMNPSTPVQDPRSILRRSSVIDINDMKQGGIIRDDRGQWDHPGEITEIGSNQITMEGVPYDVLGISDTGDTKLMKPGKNYKFKGKKVTEYPMAKNGLRQEQKGLVNLDNLLNFTNYNKPQPGGWLSKYE